MAFLSLTRLHLRAWYYLPAFLLHATRSRAQAEASPGFIAGALAGDVRRLTFWTMTLWTNEAAMRAYRGSGAHRKAMLKVGDLCDETSVAHREHATEALPSAEEAFQLMHRHGRVSRLMYPSPAHVAGETVPDARPPRFAVELRSR